MAGRIVLRTAGMVLVILAVVTITFFVLRVAAGDPARLVNPPGTPEEIITQTRQRLGLAKPLIAQYGDFLGGLIQGDLGTSFRGANPVGRAVLKALPNTLALAAVTMVVASILAVVLGMAAALKPNGLVDRVVLLYVSVAWATPSFWLAVILVFFFSIKLGWFPAVDLRGPKSFVLPVAT